MYDIMRVKKVDAVYRITCGRILYEVNTMTKDQHVELKTLREGGASHAEIAAILHMPTNTVKVYCYRHGIQLPKLLDAANICAHCGQALVPRTKRKKRFCSDACRTAWWNGHRTQLHRRIVVQRACAYCGTLFESYPVQNRRFCSHPCYISARYGGSTAGESIV